MAPFFIKRVFQIDIGLPPVAMQQCAACEFIQTTIPFSADTLARLYEDYRSDSYNRERIAYEPGYAAVADNIGGGYIESGMDRVTSLTRWLQARASVGDSMLDYGGADGRFLPALPGAKYVYDISDVTPVEGVTRVTELESYGYVQLAHVLEHVSDPLGLTRRAAELVDAGGYLMVEVPQDLPDTLPGYLLLHEHINFYCASAVRCLLEAVGLEVVDVGAVFIQSAYRNQFCIRGLARK